MSVSPIDPSGCYNQPPPTSVTEAPSANVVTDQIQVGTQPVQVVGQDATRRSLTLVADYDNTDDVYIVGSQANPAAMGVRVKAGGGFTFSTGAPLYVVANSGTQKVYVVAETRSM